MNADELRPCPHCGCAAHVSTIYNYNGWHEKWYQCGCNVCGDQRPAKRIKQEAIKDWNGLFSCAGCTHYWREETDFCANCIGGNNVTNRPYIDNYDDYDERRAVEREAR